MVAFTGPDGTITSLEHPRHGTIVLSPVGSFAILILRRVLGYLANSARIRSDLLSLNELLSRARREPILATLFDGRLVAGHRRLAELFDATLCRQRDCIHRLEDPVLTAVTLYEDFRCGLPDGDCLRKMSLLGDVGPALPRLSMLDDLRHRSAPCWSDLMNSRAG